MARTGYTGLSAASYDLWFGGEGFEDVEFYREAIGSGGEPALEAACGTGRLLIPYVRDGLDVEGLDRSGEMLEICRRKAESAGLRVTLHQARMESFALDRKFRTIYVPFGSFMLLADATEATAALRCFRAHLADGGRVLIPLHHPWRHDIGVAPAPSGEWRLRRVATRPEDEAIVRCYERTTLDFDRQIQQVRLRFEVSRGGEVVESQEDVQRLRWYEQAEFACLLAAAGFERADALEAYTWEPAAPDSASFMFVAG